MAEKVVLQLASGEDYGVDQLLDLWVTRFGLQEYLADEIDQPLDRQCMPLLLPLDHHRCTDDLGCRGNIKEQRFCRLRWDQDWC